MIATDRNDVGEDHVIQDLGFIPSLGECLEATSLPSWVGGLVKRKKRPTSISIEDLKRIRVD